MAVSFAVEQIHPVGFCFVDAHGHYLCAPPTTDSILASTVVLYNYCKSHVTRTALQPMKRIQSPMITTNGVKFKSLSLIHHVARLKSVPFMTGGDGLLLMEPFENIDREPHPRLIASYRY